MTTGMEGGSFVVLGERYRQVLARDGIQLQLLASSGSVENLTRLKDESKVAEVGFVQGGIGKAEPASKLVSLGSVFYSPLWVFTRGPDRLDDLSLVRGKRISIGPEGSGVRRASLALLKAADAFDPPAELFEYSMADAGKALKEGRLDAVMTFGSADSALVIELINAPGIQLMKNHLFLILVILLGMTTPVYPGDAKEINLPTRPSKSNVDIVTALEQRRTTREYSTAKLSLDDLSAILWAANGVNRPDGKRTAPSAHGRQYIDIYVAGDKGVYRYDAPSHKLIEVTDQNVKERLARQGHVATSSHVLVLVADLNKVPGSAGDTKLYFAHSTAGTIAENVHLMAAARGVGTGIVAGIKADDIRAALNLAKDAVPLYVMPLGYLK